MDTSEILKNDEVAGDSSTAKKINSLLNSSKSRVEGLQLLNFYLPQCPDEDFLQYCINWAQNCCKTDHLITDKDFTIQLLTDLLKKSSQYPELKKSVSFFITTRYFDYFFKYFLHSERGWLCTETCMLLYRGACGPFQENLEKQLEQEIRKNSKVSSTIAYCYALLPSIGGGGNEGICYKNKWKTQFVKFLSIAQYLLQNLFANVEELEEYEIPEHPFEGSQCEKNAAYFTIQMHNHCNVLYWMLLSQYPSLKSIPADLIFQLICRGFAVTPNILKKFETSETISLQENLPEIHYSLLSVLKALIVACKNQLLPYSHLICKLIKQTLEYTEIEYPAKAQNSFGSLRVSAYETLCNWLVATGSGSCVELISNVVILNAINDITWKERTVLLKEAKRQEKPKKKGKLPFRISVAFSDRHCHAALKALQFLLKFAGISLKPEEQKFLQEFVVKSIVQVQRSTSTMIVPFTLTSCRLGLYTLLLELLLQPCPKWPPPTHFALRLFSRGLNDTSPEISLFCSTALSMTTVIIHPQYSVAGFSSFQSLSNKSHREVELQSKGVLVEEESEDIEMFEENISNLNGDKNSPKKDDNVGSSDVIAAELKDKLSHLDEESNASSDEDSTNTITFTKNSNDFNGENLDKVDKAQENSPNEMSLTEDGPSPKLRRTVIEKSFAVDQNKQSFETSPVTTITDQKKQSFEASPVTRELESKLAESCHSDLGSTKSFSPESASEEGQLKKRYFLRSKTKGSSEEPEEMMKRPSSFDSLKSTPVKASPRRSPSVQSTTKRPRTRASSKTGVRSSEELNEPKGAAADDDEDILKAFDDSLVE